MGAPRVRIAPSPTGFFHVGTARTALFNWFVARQAPGGVFILRIEDTDATRNREEWVAPIVDSLAWLGLDLDEGPYRQSDNALAHDGAAQLLRRSGYLYYCDCTGEALAARKAPGAPPGYDGFCRDRGLDRGPTTALRFRTPLTGTTLVSDEVRGEVVFDNAVIDDFVVAKSTGAVLYALANVVDDRHDKITHVIRGEEHLANAPKQMLLWAALNDATGDYVALPSYAHLPLLVNERRQKLSKRKDPVSTESYRNEGYLAEAVVNYLALLGWSPRGDEEKVTREVLVEQFRLGDVSHSPAFFDVKKLTHLNGEYLRELDPEEFVAACAPWVCPWSTSWRPSDRTPPWSEEQFHASLFARVAPLVHERVATLSQVVAMVDFFFLDEPVIDEASFHKVVLADPQGPVVLAEALRRFELLGDWDGPTLHAVTSGIGDEVGLSLRRAQAPIRCAVTGRLVGPPLFESLEYLGRRRTVQRLRAALARTL